MTTCHPRQDTPSRRVSSASPLLATLLLWFAHGAVRLDAAQPLAHEFENLSNANASFPQVFFFRHDDAPPSYLDDSAAPQTRQAFLNRLDGCISKVFHEERTDLPTDKLRATYRELRAQHPEKTVLVHFNGEAVAVRHFDWIADDRYPAIPRSVTARLTGKLSYAKDAIRECRRKITLILKGRLVGAEILPYKNGDTQQ